MSQKPKTRGKRTTRVICRTTSESLRLFDTEPVSTTAVTHVVENLTQSKSSFVVTNVVSSAGVDSPEDESHSEEISRITDLETPSYSEETYSKDVDDEIPQPLGAGAVNVAEENVCVPLDIVLLPAKSEQQSPESISANAPFALENQTSVIEVTTVQEQPKAAEERGVFIAKCNRSIGRFQVVKVESIEPFYRGRWTCHDYLDNSQHAPAEGWVFHQDRFIKKSESQPIPISPNIPDSLPNPNKQIPVQSQTQFELHNEAPPAIVERTQGALSSNIPSFVGQSRQATTRNRIVQPPLPCPGHGGDVYLNNQYNLLSPDVLQQVPTKSSLTKTHSSVSTSLHGTIAHTPPPSPNGNSLMQTVELNLPISQVQQDDSFLQTPPETPLSLVYQYRNSKAKVPSEPVTPLQPVASTTQNSNYFSLPTLLPVSSRTYPSLSQTDFAQNTYAPVLSTNEGVRKLNRSRTVETVKEIKRQLSGDEAGELIAHVETYLSGTDALDGDKDYIIMVKRSTDGTTGDNVVICREVDCTKTEGETIKQETAAAVLNSKGAIKKQLQISYSDPAFKESCYNNNNIKSSVQKLKQVPPPVQNSGTQPSSNYKVHKEFKSSIEEEVTERAANQYLKNLRLNLLDLSYREDECYNVEEKGGFTPSSEESEDRARLESLFPGHFPVYREWSDTTDETASEAADGENAKKSICLICDISASLNFTVQVSHNSEIERVTSCANSVIDHKIEQAMDMVKTHLMHSMRAEVESLRAKITELLERIHQLEIENDFLKSNAAPEVLIALNNGAAKIRSNDPGSPNNNNNNNNNFMTQPTMN